MKTIGQLLSEGAFPRGLDTPWLGEVSLTADGCVVGHRAKVWVAFSNWRDGVGIVESAAGLSLTDEEDFVRESWSTPEGPIPRMRAMQEALAAGRKAAEQQRVIDGRGKEAQP